MPVSEMADQDNGVLKRGAAVATHRCVGRMGEVGNGVAGVVDAEPHDIVSVPAERSNVGVVGIQHEHRRFVLGGEVIEQVAPFVDEGFEFAVPIELIAEQVHEHHDLGLGRGSDRGKGGLVDFEQAYFSTVCAFEQRSGDTSLEVGALGVGHHVITSNPGGRSEQPGCGCFSVGSGNQDAAVVEICCILSDGVWAQFEQHHTGKCRAAASAQPSAEPTRGIRYEASQSSHSREGRLSGCRCGLGGVNALVHCLMPGGHVMATATSAGEWLVLKAGWLIRSRTQFFSAEGLVVTEVAFEPANL